jgi:hypothetical protein
MTTIVALGIPLLVVAAAWAVFRPGDLLRRLPGPSATVDRSPLPYRTHLAWTAPYLVLSFGLGWAFTLVQHALLIGISGKANWWFSWRTTDKLIYAAVPGLFLGLLVAFPMFLRIAHWHYGEKLVPLLDRRGRDMSGLSLRQDIALMPRIAVGTALAAVLLNAAAFDTFLQVGEGVFRFSYFFSPTTHEYAVQDVSELAVYSQRIAPNGKVTNKSFLEIRMRDGTEIDTYYLIEEDLIPKAVAALLDSAGGRVRVSYVPHPK